MQVHQGNREKKIAKLGIKLLRLKLGKKASVDSIHDYLVGNDPGLKLLVDTINEAADSIIAPYQQRRIREYGELGIWIALNHPKIRPVVIKALNNICSIRINKSNLPKVKLSLMEQKIMMKVLRYTASKIIKGRYGNIRGDLTSASNRVIYQLFLLANQAVSSIIGLSDEDKSSITVLFDCGLWTMTHDTAYRDTFFWSVYKVGNKSVKSLVKSHSVQLIKPPERWYPNVWWYGKHMTKMKLENGELSPGQFSEIEKHCVPQIQEQLLKQGR